MSLCLNVPINSVSFGQISIAILREIHRRGLPILVCPIGQGVDFSSQEEDDEDFFNWVNEGINNFQKKHDRKNPSIKIWHLTNSLESVSEKQILLSFYETDKPTETELNIARNNKVAFTSRHSIDVFESRGVKTHYVPLGFDSDNFKVTDTKFHEDDRIIFNISGKLEKRKRHDKAIKAWIKKFGNDKRYFLHASVYNHFLSPEQNNAVISKILDDKKYFNITFFPYMAKNITYNEYLNAAHIVLGVSGGEGWGLPEFQSVALGKYGVIMNAHGYKSWANEKNSILIKAPFKIDSHDAVFFKKGAEFNQGKFFDFDEDEFIHACELAIAKYEKNPVNEEGLKLQNDFTFKKTVDSLLELL